MLEIIVGINYPKKICQNVMGCGGNMNRVTSQQYLDMWLSEQIPTNEWLQILEERSDVRKLYNKHMESK
tara:strand:- start:874 stop:1080 length:207 start_codon:yes stop_codon:yes gene_type:complete